MPALVFTPVEIPEQVVVRKENEFAPLVASLIESGKAMAFAMPNKTDDEQKTLKAAINRFQKAANDVGKSGRRKIVDTHDSNDKHDGTATVTVWLVDKIHRTAS